MTTDAIRKIMETHPIKSLFVWSFTPEGRSMANSVSNELKLPLFERK